MKSLCEAVHRIEGEPRVIILTVFDKENTRIYGSFLSKLPRLFDPVYLAN